VPLTSTDRCLLHHVAVPAGEASGLTRMSYAMTEQVRTLASGRIDRELGALDQPTMSGISRYVHLFIG
jgi:mRNA-degrading endonuclease toxin of MazEF toxin-antitoxin module